MFLIDVKRLLDFISTDNFAEADPVIAEENMQDDGTSFHILDLF